MLDQNTDRMWYVIGAVIIGAALIFIVNSTFPQVFASVGETFKDKTDETTGIVDGIGALSSKNYLGPDGLVTSRAEILAYDATAATYDMRIQQATSWQSDGFFVKSARIAVPYGQTFTLSYEVYLPDGVNGLVAELDINNHPIKGTDYGWNGNDNDARALRKYNGHSDYKRAISLNAGEWNKIMVSYVNSSELNVKKEDIYDYTRFGVTNTTGQPLDVKIRNIYVDVY